MDSSIRDFKLDSTGDLDTSNGDVVGVTGARALLQNIRIRFFFFFGEWFLDTRQGFPWFQEVFVKAPDIARITFQMKQLLKTTVGVSSVTEFEFGDVNAATRQVRVRFKVVLDTGLVVSSDMFGPFILDFTSMGL